MNDGTTRGTDGRRWARYTVFALMSLFLLLGSALVLGETFADPGGWAAVVVAAAWVVPAAALSVFALLRPASAERVLPIVTLAVAALVVVESLTGLVPQDEVGPVATVAAFATSIPLAFLGLHRPGRAGLLLLVTGMALAIGALGGAPRASATVVAAPLLLFGLLFLATEPPTRRSGGVAQLPDGGGPPGLEPRHRHPER
ncbi:hypothetical protein K1X13_08155 [Nocardioides sp. WL0053]|uniref:Uncharacterized protein n=1 Tax=Nocardioides jiangsuensis TaxID=2866161 RepID=A0ABS7RID7_9ACTN|nr:hypothetical protein [Nocardioides jiangsuensis]MBY9074789.1 hypothetical protein [Nocardioides jiangsuensis]